MQLGAKWKCTFRLRPDIQLKVIYRTFVIASRTFSQESVVLKNEVCVTFATGDYLLIYSGLFWANYCRTKLINME